MLTLHCTSKSEDDTLVLGAAVGRVLRVGDLVALSGQLGAGKTRLVRGLAAGFGADADEVSSPTYVVAQEYAARVTSASHSENAATSNTPVENTPGQDRSRVLVHIDAYRLGGVDDLETIGFDAMRSGSAAIAIEWPEKIGVVGPFDGQTVAERSVQHELVCDLRVTLEHIGDGADSRRRSVTISVSDVFAARAGFGRVVDEAVRLGAGIPEGWARCPVTRRAVHPDSPTFPFVDERARIADLGKWMSGSYVVSRELTEDDLMNPDLPVMPTDPSTDGHSGTGGRRGEQTS